MATYGTGRTMQEQQGPQEEGHQARLDTFVNHYARSPTYGGVPVPRRNASTGTAAGNQVYSSMPITDRAIKQAEQPRRILESSVIPTPPARRSSEAPRHRTTPSTSSSGSSQQSLDNIDIEALIATYKPMLHPSVRESLAERCAAIETVKRDLETRLSPRDPSSSQTREYETSVLPSSSQASSSRPPLSATGTRPSTKRNISFGSQSTSTESTRTSPSTRSHRSILKPAGHRPITGRKGSFLSGEIEPEDENDIFGIRPPSGSRSSSTTAPTLDRTSSQRSWSSVAYSNKTPSPALSTASQTTFLSGSIDCPPNLDNARPAPMPPVPSIPSRFTQATASSAGPGALYDSQREQEDMPIQTEGSSRSADNSPRSSMSSKQSHASFRWSSESAKTASSARSTPLSISRSKQSVDSGHGEPASISPIKKNENGATLDSIVASWLSFDDEDEQRAPHNSETPVAPTMTRKNSLWRESLDSVASSKLDLEDYIAAQDFPTPPTMSRSNSASAALGSTHPSQQSSAVNPELLAALGNLSNHESAPGMARKDSVTGFLRVHSVSPLSRRGSASSVISQSTISRVH